MPNSLPNIHVYSTKQLVEELLTRQGVEQLTVAPYKEYNIKIEETWEENYEDWFGTGTARILIITD